MSNYIITGNTIQVKGEKTLSVSKNLPVGNYVVKESPQIGLFLESVDSFILPSRIFGNTPDRSKRIINTFLDRSSSTGVLLAGEKGSGKTLLAKTLSIECAKLGYPTIIINKDWHGDDFNQLIQNIDQPAVVMFDEFEKVYDEEKQEAVLTLLDGVYPTKKLFIITCNDKWRISQHMRNRPGRLFYMIDYKGLDQNFIIEYCDAVLKEKKHTQLICRISGLFDAFNFDILKALVEEMNRYGEDPIKALEILNAKPGSDSAANFAVTLSVKGKTRDKRDIYPCEIEGLPLGKTHSFTIYAKTDKQRNEVVEVGEDNIVSVDTEKGIFVYKKDDYTFTMKREDSYNCNYYKFL